MNVEAWPKELEAVTQLGIHYGTLLRLVKAGQLRRLRDPPPLSAWRYDPMDVQRLQDIHQWATAEAVIATLAVHTKILLKQWSLKGHLVRRMDYLMRNVTWRYEPESIFQLKAKREHRLAELRAKPAPENDVPSTAWVSVYEAELLTGRSVSVLLSMGQQKVIRAGMFEPPLGFRCHPSAVLQLAEKAS
jgi:hypothetical protein